jgi:hypothetical protein
MRRVAFAGLVGLLVVVAGALPAEGHRTTVTVEILSVQALLAPDGRSMTFDIETRCDRKATIVEARVTATQAQASGEGPFTPSCVQIPNVVRVTVPVQTGTFETGPAQVSVRLSVRQGSTKSASDSASVRVRPSVGIQVADQAVLEPGGGAVRLDVTVTCPRTSTAQGGQVTVFQDPAGGTGFFGPTPCDGVSRTMNVRVPAARGSYRLGSADIEAFTSVEEGGDLFPSSDVRTIQIVAG